MVLRDKRVWWGAVAALLLAFVSYSVVSGLTRKTSNVAQQTTMTGSPQTSTTRPHTVPDGDVTIPAVVGDRLSQAKAKLSAVGLSNVHAQDATGKNRIVLNDSNWIVEVQSPAADTPVDPRTEIILKVRKPTDAHSPQSTPFGTVPDVVCANLQDAQNALRGAGFFVLTSKDGTGRGRTAIFDRNWVVTAQSVKPGTRPSLTTHVELTVVKYGEPTNNPDCQS
jgi:beta-lactam-binding protein with PASTA domain